MQKYFPPTIWEDQDGNILGRWQITLAYVDSLGNPAGLEDFKQILLSRGIPQQEIDDALAEYRATHKK